MMQSLRRYLYGMGVRSTGYSAIHWWSRSEHSTRVSCCPISNSNGYSMDNNSLPSGSHFISITDVPKFSVKVSTELNKNLYNIKNY